VRVRNAASIRAIGYPGRVQGDRVVLESVEIAAPPALVWRALTTPAELARWYFEGIQIASTYRVGDPITFAFALDGAPHHDHGTILAAEPGVLLAYDHWSALSGRPDAPEGRTRVTLRLVAVGPRTRVDLRHEGFVLDTELFHARFFWRVALVALADHVLAASPSA